MGPALPSTRPVQKSPNPPSIVAGRVSRIIRMVNLLQSTERCTAEQLANVTIKADGALIRQIEQGLATVVALVHLSSSEKERRIESKAVTCFMALPPQGPGTIVEAEVDGSKLMPVIRLQISDRSAS